MSALVIGVHGVLHRWGAGALGVLLAAALLAACGSTNAPDTSPTGATSAPAGPVTSTAPTTTMAVASSSRDPFVVSAATGPGTKVSKSSAREPRPATPATHSDATPVTPPTTTPSVAPTTSVPPTTTTTVDTQQEEAFAWWTGARKQLLVAASELRTTFEVLREDGNRSRAYRTDGGRVLADVGRASRSIPPTVSLKAPWQNLLDAYRALGVVAQRGAIPSSADYDHVETELVAWAEALNGVGVGI